MTKVTAIQVALSKKEYKQLNINIMKNSLITLVMVFALFIMNSVSAQTEMVVASVDVTENKQEDFHKYYAKYDNADMEIKRLKKLLFKNLDS